MTAEPIYRSVEGEQAVMAAYESALAQWPAPCERVYLPTRYGETHVIASGEPDAPALLLLHGAGMNSAVWMGDVTAYCRHFRVYAADIIGEAGKSEATRPPWDGPAFAEWLADVLDGLGVQHAALVGQSQGGWIALKFATFAPERVTQLVLISPGGVVKDRASLALRALPLVALGPRGVPALKQLFIGDIKLTPEADAFVTLSMTHFKARVGVLPLFTDAELRRVTMPVLLIGGARDALRDINRIAARLKTLLPQLTAMVLPDAGHVVLNTTETILPFLTAADRNA